MSDGKAGRPKKEIDWALFEQLCALHCTRSEIASVLNIGETALCEKTLEHYGEDFRFIYKKYQETGKCSLRRAQFALSKKNAAMGIWLGKQYLDQKDNSKETEKMLTTFTGILERIDNSTKELVQQPKDAS